MRPDREIAVGGKQGVVSRNSQGSENPPGIQKQKKRGKCRELFHNETVNPVILETLAIQERLKRHRLSGPHRPDKDRS